MLRSYRAGGCRHPLVYGYQAHFSRGHPARGPGFRRTLYQDLTLPSYTAASLEFLVDLEGDLTAEDRLTVTIRDPGSGAVLETVAVVRGDQRSLDCGWVSRALRGDYANRTIRVQFQATFGLASTLCDSFLVDESAVWSH